MSDKPIDVSESENLLAHYKRVEPRAEITPQDWIEQKRRINDLEHVREKMWVRITDLEESQDKARDFCKDILARIKFLESQITERAE